MKHLTVYCIFIIAKTANKIVVAVVVKIIKIIKDKICRIIASYNFMRVSLRQQKTIMKSSSISNRHHKILIII